MNVASRVKRLLSGHGREPLQWTIVTSAPKGEAGEQWGDTWFARDLAAALRRAGQRARVVSRAGATSDRRAQDDVVIVLRGLRAVVPPVERSSVWMLWVISHPDSVGAEELRSYDAVFAASEQWQAPEGIEVTPLLQATDPNRFAPPERFTESTDLLFVGSTRGEFRPAVRGALRSGRADDLRLYGVGWTDFVEPSRITGEFLANEDLPAAYAGAGIVLNDHHRDMAEQGFLSNRLFDAVASGARVLTDPATGMKETFGASVVVFENEDHLVELLSQPVDAVFGDDTQRRSAAARIAERHSFDERARVLIERAQALGASHE